VGVVSSPKWRRARRVERRKVERAERPATAIAIPDAVRALAPRPGPPQARRHLPCLVDPDCPVDHLHRRKGARRG
jgi:hypothetical protein